MANIIGISAHFHDAACCLLKDGALIAAAEEERFTRRKHDADIPRSAFRYCLDAGKISIEDVDCVAYYEKPTQKLARQLWAVTSGAPGEESLLERLDGRRPEREIRDLLGYEGHIEYTGHHLAHAASAFFYSGFAESAVLTVDGVGEWETTTYGRGEDRALEMFEAVEYPDSIGLLYSALTGYLGFEVNEGEYKVMGLAPYGAPRYKKEVRALLEILPQGQFRLRQRYFDFNSPALMHTDALIELFGRPARRPDADIETFHKDVARSLQAVLETVLLEKVRYLHERTGSEHLCMAGGVALNCVANGRIRREGPFKRVFVQPAANDAGACLGAAALVAGRLDGATPRRLKHVYLGPSFGRREVLGLLEATGLAATDFGQREADLFTAVADRLARGDVIGWFQGHMEFGPRALGGRSILADPRDPTMRDRINALVKKREAFRPFAPAILDSRRRDHFDLDEESPFMLETCQVASALDLPAVTHVDGSARVQTVTAATNPRFAALLAAFERRTGCPILLNTSFNMRGEPIVCTPADALLCFIRSDIDALVLGDFIVDRAALTPALQQLRVGANSRSRPAISHQTYTLF